MKSQGFLLGLAIVGWGAAAFLAPQALSPPPGRKQAPAPDSQASAAQRQRKPTRTVKQAEPPPDPARKTDAPTLSYEANSAPPAAVDSLANLSEQLRGELLTALSSHGGDQLDALLELGLQPSNADFRRMMEEKTEEEGSLQAAHGLIRLWAHHDPAAAAEWIVNRQDSRLFRYGVGIIVREWSSKDAGAAYAWVINLPSGRARDRALSLCAQRLSAEDPETAAAALDRMDKDNYRAHAARTLARNWLQSDSEAATAWIQSLPAGPAKDRGLAAKAHKLAEDDPLGALETSLAIEDENIVSQTIGQIVRIWANQDLNAAADFVKTLPEGSSRNHALSNLAISVAESDPEAALDWAKSIPPDSQRRRTQISIVNRWISSNPGAALQWVEQSSLSERRKGYLRRRAERARERSQ